jgi:hypothetical protein
MGIAGYRNLPRPVAVLPKLMRRDDRRVPPAQRYPSVADFARRLEAGRIRCLPGKEAATVNEEVRRGP